MITSPTLLKLREMLGGKAGMAGAQGFLGPPQSIGRPRSIPYGESAPSIIGGEWPPNTGGPSLPPGPPGDPRLTGPSPFEPRVTAGTVDVTGAPAGRVDFATADRPNVNYGTQDAAEQYARRFGGQVNTQNLGGDYGPAGAPSEPIRSLSFPNQPNNLGYEVDIPAGQIAFWLLRGDSEADIRERLGLDQSRYQAAR